MKILPRKINIELLKAGFPLSVRRRQEHFDSVPNTHCKWGTYIPEIYDEELEHYERELREKNTDDIDKPFSRRQEYGQEFEDWYNENVKYMPWLAMSTEDELLEAFNDDMPCQCECHFIDVMGCKCECNYG